MIGRRVCDIIISALVAGALYTGCLDPAQAQQNVQTIGPVTPGDIVVYNSPTIVKDSGFSPSTIFNFVCTLAPTACSFITGNINAQWYGVKCDGTTLTDAANTQLAVNASIARGGIPVIMPGNTTSCPWTQNVFYNSWSAPGPLTVPGMKIFGQGKQVTKIDTRVANGYALSANPDWKAAHQSLYLSSVTTSGTLATNTYFVQVTMTDPSGNEIRIGIPKSYSVIGTTGSVTIPLQAVNPGYTYNIYFDTASTPAHYATVNSANAIGLAGNQTVVITAIGSAQAFPTNKVAIWQEASIKDLSITNTTAAANASGALYFRVGYSDITNVLMTGLTGDGLDIPNYTGDVDGSFIVNVTGSKFDTIAVWCINAAGNTLEFSNFTLNTVSFNKCGTATVGIGTTHVISAISNANPGIVTTSTNHTVLLKDQVRIFGVTGMTLADGDYRACGTVTPTTFQLCTANGDQVDTTSLGSYNANSGSEYLAWRPPVYNLAAGTISGSGAVAYVGLISAWRNLDFTQNNITNIYFSEAGTSDNATFEGIDMENTAGVGAYIASLSGGAWNQGECLSAAALGATVSCLQLGTGFAAGGVKNFNLAWSGSFKVRMDSADTPVTAFEQFQNTNIGNTFKNSVRVGPKIDWQTFDATGQTRFSGFVFDPIPGQVNFSISAANTVKLVPVGYGGCLPLRLAATGEWVCFQVPSTGITGAVTGGLTPTTTYNCYAYNSASAGLPLALSYECNATATAIDTTGGYKIKSGDPTRTFIGTAPTDGSGNFQSSGAFVSWYPPSGAVTAALGIQNGFAFYASTSVIGSTAAGTDGQIPTGQTGNPPLLKTMSGDATYSAVGALTLASTITAGGPTGSATVAPIITYDAKGRLTTVSSATITPAVGSITGLGTGVPTALGVNVGTAGSFVVNGGALGSPSSAGTIPAFTLGGTITAGGNSISGVGGLSATAVVSPLIVGGNGTTGLQLELRTTSGVGTTDKAVISGGNNGGTAIATFLGTGKVGLGSSVGAQTPTNTTLAVSNNVTVVDAAQAGLSPVLQVVAADSALTTVLVDNFGANVGAAIAFRNAGGTAASKLASNGTIGTFFGIGYDTSAYAFGPEIDLVASQAWSASAHGSSLKFWTVVNGTTTQVNSMTLLNSGGLAIGGSTDPAAGGLFLNGQIFVPNMTGSVAGTDPVCWTTGTGKLTTATACTASSERYKEQIVSLDSGDSLNEVMKLRPVSFRYKPEFRGASHQGPEVGFIAEEVEKVDSRLMFTNKDGQAEGVLYDKTSALLTGAFQKLKMDFDSLKADNDNLHEEIKRLRTK